MKKVFSIIPEKLTIGTGASGIMKVSGKVLDMCEKLGIEI